MLKSTHASAQNFIFHLLFVVNPRSQFLFLFTFCSESSSNPTAKVILEDRQGLSGKFIIPVVYALSRSRSLFLPASRRPPLRCIVGLADWKKALLLAFWPTLHQRRPERVKAGRRSRLAYDCVSQLTLTDQRECIRSGSGSAGCHACTCRTARTARPVYFLLDRTIIRDSS